MPKASHTFGADGVCTVCGKTVHWESRTVDDSMYSDQASTLHVINTEGQSVAASDEVKAGIQVLYKYDEIDANGNVTKADAGAYSDYTTDRMARICPYSLEMGRQYHVTVSHRSGMYDPVEFTIVVLPGGMPVLQKEPGSSGTVGIDVSD